MELLKLYDEVYINYDNYNSSILNKSGKKQIYVDNFINKNDKILDIGCGSGYTLKRLYNKGYDIFGIDFSRECCNRYLKDFPHECVSILDYCNRSTIVYDVILCIDVLEHIPYNQIDNTLFNILGISNKALFGIANHSDIKCGVELHIIQEKVDWWLKKINTFYVRVKYIDSLFDNRFFFIETS